MQYALYSSLMGAITSLKSDVEDMKRSRSLRRRSKSQVSHFFLLNCSSLAITCNYMDGQEKVVHYLLFSHTLLKIGDHTTAMTAVYRIE